MFFAIVKLPIIPEMPIYGLSIIFYQYIVHPYCAYDGYSDSPLGFCSFAFATRGKGAKYQTAQIALKKFSPTHFPET